MNSEMVIQLDWLPPFRGTAEVQRTSATIEIRFGSESATRFEDGRSQSVQQGARVGCQLLIDGLEKKLRQKRCERFRQFGAYTGASFGQSAIGSFVERQLNQSFRPS